MEAYELECIIAAILTVASLDGTGHVPNQTVLRYKQIIDELRRAGGPVHPLQPHP
jgi:hypothetical protein